MHAESDDGAAHDLLIFNPLSQNCGRFRVARELPLKSRSRWPGADARIDRVLARSPFVAQMEFPAKIHQQLSRGVYWARTGEVPASITPSTIEHTPTFHIKFFCFIGPFAL